ncbi:YetF domain-containing protein [Enterococcus faecalis]
MFHGIIGIVIFAAIPFFAGLLSLKSKRFRDFIEGRATVFIKDGKIMEDNLKKERYTTDELLESASQEGCLSRSLMWNLLF